VKQLCFTNRSQLSTVSNDKNIYHRSADGPKELSVRPLIGRGQDTMDKNPEADTVIKGDLSGIEEVKFLHMKQINQEPLTQLFTTPASTGFPQKKSLRSIQW
jgi:hypothetical protein